jgi:hypothetical protein
MDIKTIWTKPTRNNLEHILYPEVVCWLRDNYPLAREWSAGSVIIIH